MKLEGTPVSPTSPALRAARRLPPRRVVPVVTASSVVASAITVWILAGPHVLPWAGSGKEAAAADGGKAGPLQAALSLDGWGKLGSAVKGAETFHDLSCYVTDAKGRRTTEKVLVEISDRTETYVDQPIRLEDLQVGEEIWVLGKAVERDVPSKRGGGLGGSRRGTDTQIQAARAILTGKAVSVNESFKDPADKTVRWHKASVNNAAAGLWVRYQNKEYRVTLEKAAPILRRTECEPKLLKSGRYVHVLGDKTSPPADAEKSKAEKAKPEKAKLDPKPAFKCRRVVLLDPRYIQTAYAAVLR